MLRIIIVIFQISLNPRLISKINRRPIMSAMENNYGIIVAGSTMGDIHFFKERALDIEKDPMTGSFFWKIPILKIPP